MFFNFEDLPEEVKEHLRKQAERMEMATDDFGHGVVRLFDELDKDALITLKSMMHLLAQNESPVAWYWEGMIVSTIAYRFGICPIHGVNHDEEMAEALGDETAGVKLPIHPEGEQITEDSFSADQRLLMAQYHVDDTYQDGTNKFLGFICTGINGMKEGCGMMYPSLEDRMMHKPEDCSGCHVKSAHG